MLDRRNWRHFDVQLLLIIFAIIAIGLVAIYGATLSLEENYLMRQLQWFMIGLVALVFVLSIDYAMLANWSYYIYGLNLLLLAAVFVVGHSGGGSQRWINLGFFNLQPSEVAKIAVIITLADMLSRRKDMDRLTDLIVPGLHIAVPMVMIFLQPDLGTSLIFIVIFLAMLFVAGFPWRKLLLVTGAGAAGSVVALWTVMEPYQRLRLTSFLNPQADPTGSAYQMIQSMVAIGSGGPTGRGLYEAATQSQLRFLPAQHTDFIFAVLGEKLGFLWGALLLVLFCLLLYRILLTAMNSKDSFGTLVCVGVASMLLFQMLVNVGMNMGIMPITGLTLPFVSYGGSSFLVNMVAIGLVLNVGMRREKIQF